VSYDFKEGLDLVDPSAIVVVVDACGMDVAECANAAAELALGPRPEIDAFALSQSGCCRLLATRNTSDTRPSEIVGHRGFGAIRLSA
jgi:hypothetical protein